MRTAAPSVAGFVVSDRKPTAGPLAIGPEIPRQTIHSTFISQYRLIYVPLIACLGSLGISVTCPRKILKIDGEF
jgi:hypothetical protein